MSRVLRSVLWAAGLGAVPFAVMLIFLPGRRELALELFLFLVAAAAVVALVRAVSATAPRARAEPQHVRPRVPQRLAELERTERAVLLSAANAFDLHYRLRPILREIAAQRLATRRGLSLDGDTADARAVVGETAWELVRPDREPPHLRFAPGITAPVLSEVVASLERI
jgi:hypothetical protein